MVVIVQTSNMKSVRLIPGFFFILLPFLAKTQSIPYDLVQMLKSRQLIAITKTGDTNEVHLITSPGRQAVSAQGMVWLKDVTFTKGKIEIDLRGKNIPGQSFIGLAFSAENEKDYECVYFRPFNFGSKDTLHRLHMVQYMSLPGNEWFVLREKQPLVFENGISPSPEATAWFHATIVADTDSIRIYVNAAKEPSLSVKRFKNHKGEKLALWSSSTPGDFARLEIDKN